MPPYAAHKLSCGYWLKVAILSFEAEECSRSILPTMPHEMHHTIVLVCQQEAQLLDSWRSRAFKGECEWNALDDFLRRSHSPSMLSASTLMLSGLREPRQCEDRYRELAERCVGQQEVHARNGTPGQDNLRDRRHIPRVWHPVSLSVTTSRMRSGMFSSTERARVRAEE